MEFKFQGVCEITLKHKPSTGKSSLVKTDFNLDVSNNLDATKYLDSDGLPTADGTKSLTMVFVQGLVGNIHQAHEKGYWDSAAHLRYIIAELERGFATVASVSKSEFGS